MVLLGNIFNNAAGLMTSLLYVMGMIGVIVLATLRPPLVLPTFLLTMPIALLLHLELRFMGLSDLFGYVVVNPEIYLVLATFVAVLMGLWVKKRRLVRTALDIPMAIFVLGSLFAVVYSPDFLYSLRVVFAGTIVPMICYYIIVNGLRTRQEFALVAAALLFSFFLMGSYSLMTFQREISSEVALSGIERLSSFFLNPGFLALMLTLILPIPLSLATSSSISLKFRLGSAVLFTILLVTLVFTYTRGAWAGFALSLAVLLLLSGEFRRLFLKTLPILLIVLFLGWSVYSQILFARNDSIADFLRSDSVTERVIVWQTARQMIIQNPVTGVGPGEFGAFFSDYEVGYLQSAQGDYGVSAHSLFLNVWAERGTLAAFGLIGVMAFSLYRSYRLFKVAKDPIVRTISLGFFAGLVGYIITASTHGQILTKITIDEQSYFAGYTFYPFIIFGLITALTRIRNEASSE